jgi:hypothetical protein
MAESRGRGEEQGRAQGGGQTQGRGVERVSAEEAWRDVAAGRALLVCAYDDESKCQKLRLEGAITLRELQRRLESVPRSQELILYCA